MNGNTIYIQRFDAASALRQVIKWTRGWFEENGNGCNAVVGISGGKDSTVTAGILVKALGADRVIGVLMPNGIQHDISDSQCVVRHLGIPYYTINIESAVNEIIQNMPTNISEQTRINIPPRIRMTMLYAIAQSSNGRVANTCNLSEDYVGYSTKYGDAAGDFALLKSFTSDEVIELGRELHLPEDLLVKPPADGLCGKTDEDNLGFTYAVLNRYIRTGQIDDPAAKERIDRLHEVNKFKEKQIERFIQHPVMHMYFTEKCHV